MNHEQPILDIMSIKMAKWDLVKGTVISGYFQLCKWTTDTIFYTQVCAGG